MDPELAKAIRVAGACDYFPARFTPNQRAKVKPWDLTPEKLAAAGLIRETWTLDVVSQDQKNSLLGKLRSRAAGNAISFAEVQRLYERRPVRVLKVMTCLNVGGWFNCGVWEGVALRDVLWLAKPAGTIRRIAIHALDSGDPSKQAWCGSLPPARSSRIRSAWPR